MMPADTQRARTLRHALRYRRQARTYGRIIDNLLLISELDLCCQERLERRIATLEAAIDRALTEGAAGCGDWRRALEEVRG